MKVLKFGGRCMGDPGMIRRVMEVITGDDDEKAVVISAVYGVTDALAAFLSRCEDGGAITEFLGEMARRHHSLLEDLVEEGPIREDIGGRMEESLLRLERLLYGIIYTEELTPRTKDLVMSFGERLAVLVLEGALRAKGTSARAVCADDLGIVTDDVHGDATARLDSCAANVGECLAGCAGEPRAMPIITGFFGATREGHCAVFGRGGSDYSASVVAYALNADLVEVWKDVPGFLTADPAMVPDAAPISRLSYDEAAELAYFGAKILHPRAVDPARQKGIPIFVRNIMDPASPGTEITKVSPMIEGTIKSVSHIQKIALIKYHGSGSGTKHGTLGNITGSLGKAGVNIYSATTSETCVSMLIDRDDVDRAMASLEDLLKDTSRYMEDCGDYSLICLVGEGLAATRGIAARTFGAVAREDVNIVLISAGASTVAFHFTVEQDDLDRTIRAVHTEIFGENGGEGR